MSNFDWTRCLEQHPVFSDLNNEEIAKLLDENVSIEKTIAQNQNIVKEGESDQSIYLIGQGAADVFLKSNHDQDVFLNSLGKGDLIGEMALFEQKKRSATVITTEPTILLEFKAKEFIKLLQTHPGISFKLLVRLSERLRNLGNDVLNAKLKDVNEKIKHVNAKLDTEIKVIDASLKATQTVFDQTSKRAHEVIDSADRSRSRFTVAASTIGTIFTLLLSGLSYMGYSKVQNVTNITKTVEQKSQLINKQFKDLEMLSKQASEHIESIEDTKDEMLKVSSKLEETNQQMKDFYKKTMVTQFHSEMNSDIEKAKKTYNSILSFNENDVSDALYRQILVEILNGEPPVRRIYAEILKSGIKNSKGIMNDRQKILSFYLLLSTFILNGENNQYNKKIKDYETTLKLTEEPVKETAEVDFGATIFEEYIKADSTSSDQSQKDKINKINTIWSMIK